MSNREEMDVVSSLKKISRELADLCRGDMPQEAVLARVEGAAWLINYIAEGLDRELQKGRARATRLIMKQLERGHE